MFKPLSSDSDTSVPTWLGNTNYPLWRRDALLKVYMNIEDPWDVKIGEVKSFIKDEPYPSMKHARPINSRSDEFKTLMGPIFKLIEKEVFTHPWFIKKIPVSKRADYIIDKLLAPDSIYYSSDYTSFEALFTREVQCACERILYEHMVKDLPGGAEFMRRYDKIVIGTNTIKNKHMTCTVRAKRMSGEMNTSLGNGFSNMMFAMFVAEESGVDIVGVVEGDDGLFRCSGPLDESLFEQLGLFIKLEKHEQLTTASFCGIVCDVSARQIITDPLPAIAEFGWLGSRYASASGRKHAALLRTKALSLAYEYPNCPMLSELAYSMLRLTQTSHNLVRKLINSSATNSYDRAYYVELSQNLEDVFQHKPNIHPSTRVLMEELFGVTVASQLRFEEYVRSLMQVEPL